MVNDNGLGGRPCCVLGRRFDVQDEWRTTA